MPGPNPESCKHEMHANKLEISELEWPQKLFRNRVAINDQSPSNCNEIFLEIILIINNFTSFLSSCNEEDRQK